MKKEIINRRDFIKQISEFTAATAFISTLPWIQILSEDEKSSWGKEKIRIGIIGVGSRGSYLTECLLQIPNADVVAFCDDYPPHYDLANKLLSGKAKGFTDYRKLLEEKNIHAVVIALPLNLHAQAAIDSLESGKHVFCEKAMAMTVEEAIKMVRTQRKTKLILQIGHQRSFNPLYLKGMEMINSGMFGRITQIRAYWHRNNDWRRPVPDPSLEKRINWRLYKDYSRGLMTELASHQLQVSNWVFNETPGSVRGSGSIVYWKDGRELDDNVSAIYTYPSGRHMVYDSMLSNKHYGLEEQILGDKGTLEFENNKFYFEKKSPSPGILQLIYDIEKEAFSTINIGGPSWNPESGFWEKGEFILDQFDLPNDTLLQMKAFVNYVMKGKNDDELLRHGYEAAVASLLGYEAIQKNQIINFDSNLKFENI